MYRCGKGWYTMLIGQVMLGKLVFLTVVVDGSSCHDTAVDL